MFSPLVDFLHHKPILLSVQIVNFVWRTVVQAPMCVCLESSLWKRLCFRTHINHYINITMSSYLERYMVSKLLWMIVLMPGLESFWLLHHMVFNCAQSYHRAIRTAVLFIPTVILRSSSVHAVLFWSLHSKWLQLRNGFMLHYQKTFHFLQDLQDSCFWFFIVCFIVFDSFRW